jgi:hypothetical protein
MTPEEASANLDKALDDAFKVGGASMVLDALPPKWKRDGQPPPATLSPEAIDGLRSVIKTIFGI